jgi:hypothetical protein
VFEPRGHPLWPIGDRFVASTSRDEAIKPFDELVAGVLTL